MATAKRRLVIALVAFAALGADHVRSASAEGLERSPVPSQAFELWSKTGSGLGALEPRCEPARRGWRFEETVDPWAKPACDLVRVTFEPGRALEIVYPWPASRDEPWAPIREMVDPWPAKRP